VCGGGGGYGGVAAVARSGHVAAPRSIPAAGTGRPSAAGIDCPSTAAVVLGVRRWFWTCGGGGRLVVSRDLVVW
jgi:hypothetical protein